MTTSDARRMSNSATIHQGVVYFPTFETARDFGYAFAKSFPEWRVVEYRRGFAVQTSRYGDYFGPNGQPTDYVF